LLGLGALGHDDDLSKPAVRNQFGKRWFDAGGSINSATSTASVTSSPNPLTYATQVIFTARAERRVWLSNYRENWHISRISER
jgi:hypothetical protein